MEDENCIFCKIVKKEIPTELTYEDDNIIAFLDIKPKAKGHTLVVTKKHYQTILDIPDSMGMDLMEAIKKVSLNLIEKGEAEGFNVVMNNYESAGQIVHHAHIHIIPRKKGDGMKGTLIF